MRCRLGCVYISDMLLIQDKEWIRLEYSLIPKDRYPEGQYQDFERYVGI